MYVQLTKNLKNIRGCVNLISHFSDSDSKKEVLLFIDKTSRFLKATGHMSHSEQVQEGKLHS